MINVFNITKIKNNKLFSNSIVGILGYVFVMISTMATRVVFVRCMGGELLGLNSLYASILHILQISELGISSAMVVSLYKPLSNKDHETVKSIMHVYKKVYNFFAIGLLLVGIFVQQFLLKYIVNVTMEIKVIKFYFLLFLIGIVSSYLFSYNKSILYAEEKNSIISIINAVSRIILAIFQIFVLIFYRNYSLYLVLFILIYLIENIVCHIYVINKHSYLKDKNIKKLKKEEKDKIIELVKPTFITRLADKLLAQVDSILINQFVNIIILGTYTNYLTIFNAIIGLFSPIGAALTSSFGNIAINSSSEEKYMAFTKIFKTMNFIVVFLCLYFISMIQDFTLLIYGKDYCLNNSTCIFLTIYLYLILTKTIYYSIQNSMGLLKLDQLHTIYQVIFNLISSFILGKYFGLNGIILGTILSLLLFPMIFKGKLLYQIAFERNAKEYYIFTSVSYIKFLIILFIIYKISNLYFVSKFSLFIIKSIAMLLICILFMVVFYLPNEIFKNYLVQIKGKNNRWI